MNHLLVNPSVLKSTLFLIFGLLFSTVDAQPFCVGSVTTNPVDVSTATTNGCDYDITVCCDILINGTHHVDFAVVTSIGTFESTVPSADFANEKACTLFEIRNIPCSEGVTISSQGFTGNGAGSACDSPAPTSAPINQPLAVEFAYFDGYVHKSNVVLQWVTESEVNSDYFEIEISKDSRNFTAIDKIQSVGNSSSKNEYQYIHKSATAGNNYYRLKEISLDGTSTYSDVVLVNIDADKEINIYPTTVNDIVNLKIANDVVGDVPVLVFNAIGNLVYSSVITDGTNELVIPTQQLESGFYFVKLKLQGIGIVTKSFTKKTM